MGSGLVSWFDLLTSPPIPARVLIYLCKFTLDLTMGESAKSLPRHDVKAFDCPALSFIKRLCHDRDFAADFSLLNLPKGKSLGRSKPATNS